jgi:signal transduction histidine kinase/DNA-binding response OmpR family regulator
MKSLMLLFFITSSWYLSAQGTTNDTKWRLQFDSLIKYYHLRDFDRFNFYAENLFKTDTYKIHDSLKVTIGATFASFKKNEREAFKYLNINEASLLKSKENKNLLGWNYYYKADWYYNNSYDKKALSNFYKADSIFTSLNRKSFISVMTKVGICDVLMKSVLGKKSLIKNQVLPYIEDGIRLSDSLGFSVPKAIFLYKKGELYFNEGDLEKSEDFYKQSLKISEEINNNTRQSLLFNRLSKILFRRNLLDSALVYQKRAVEKAKGLNDFIVISEANLELGILYNKIKKYNKAIEHLDYAKEALQKSRFTRKEAYHDIEYNLAEAYFGKNEFKKGYIYLRSAKQNIQEAQRIKNIEKVEEIEAKYQNEKKEQQIQLLTVKNNLAEKQKINQGNIYISAISIVSLAGLFFFFQYRNRQKTNKKLREIDAAKSTFFTNISHEFRTPLTLIKGPIEDQLENTTLPLAQYRNLKAAHRNTERLENLVGQLLSLSKLESSTTRLSVQPENLDKFIRIYTEAFQYQSDEQGLTFSLSTEITERISWFDQDIFEKIIYNLLGNALKFTSENGSIEVKGITRDNHLFLEVYNTSTPYSDTEIALLFTRFYQSTPNNSGTGIGLSLIKQLVALHKGTISMKNSGDGILFCVQIPVSKEFYSEAEILNEHLHSDLVPKTDHIRTEVDPAVLVPEDAPIILVVDDSVDILHYLKSIFQDTYEVLAAKDGAEAIILAKEHIPDIIVSDILMPKMDGYQLTEQIKNDPLTSHIPIILLTAKDKTIDELEAMDLGADSYMTKPFSSKLLLAKVQNLIENRRKLQQRFAQELILTPKEIAVTTADEEFLTRLQDVLEKNLTKTDFSASKFSDVMFMNRMQLHRKLKALTGLSSSEFLKTQRLKMATQLMKTKDLSVSEIGYTIGFNDPSYFTKCFKQEYGMTPKEYTVKHKE